MKAKKATIKKGKYPILEFDSSPQAIIEPKRVIKPIEMPEHCVICFFPEVITKFCKDRKAKIIKYLKNESGSNPVYKMKFKGKPLCVFHALIGAPAAAGFLEELIALGGRKFIVCGGAGVLNKDICCGHIVVPDIALRDEGTSYHYLPPGREVKASQKGVAAIKKVLKKYRLNYLIGKTWTTDGVYRETPAKVQMRKSEGCLTVEMESAAFFAVAKFRKVILAQLLYGGDDVSSSEWNTRQWESRTSVREKLFWLAAEACLTL